MTLLSVILHCDLDCFYAQVERERLKLPRDACIAVTQWSMALAVSYPARKFGINRGSSMEDILRLAGNAVTIVPVETIAGPDSSRNTEDAPNPPIESFTSLQGREKVSLARYREASANVFTAIAEALSAYDAKLERASIDEAYIDVTTEVDRRHRMSAEGCQWPRDTVVVGNNLNLQLETDMRLARGAEIAAEVRRRVLEKCNYTMSAGISVNKLLAKLASTRNKPNKQTLLPKAAVPDLMRNIPLRKLRGLGGKLGRQVETLGPKTAGEATLLTIETLFKELKKRKDAEFVYKCVRGIDETEVTERDSTKSVLAAKSFRAEMSIDMVRERWLPLLASELVERLEFDTAANKRDATTLIVSFRVRPHGQQYGMVRGSRSVPMPPAQTKDRVLAVTTAALSVLTSVLYKEKQFSFPINFVGITAADFRSRATEKESISTYFTKLPGSELKMANEPNNRLRDVNRRKSCQKRLQERADRELALRLHRAESLGGVTKPRWKELAHESSPARATKAKGCTSGRPVTLDNFFKPSLKRTRR